MFGFPPPGNVGYCVEQQVRHQADHHREQIAGPETEVTHQTYVNHVVGVVC